CVAILIGNEGDVSPNNTPRRHDLAMAPARDRSGREARTRPPPLPDHFSCTPAILIASLHIAMSAAIMAANSTGVLPSGSMPKAARRSADFPSLPARETSFAIRSMVSLGTAAGAIRPFQVSTLNP